MSMARPLIDRLTAPISSTPDSRPSLSPVARGSRRRRPKVFYAGVSVGFVLLVIVAQILLSIALQSGAYEISGLQQQVRDLGRAHQSASQDIDRLASPQNIAQSAEALGMVGNSTPAYLRLSSGATAGWVSQATAGATLYPEGDMVPNEQLTDIFAQREAAARNAELAREAAARASTNTGSASTANTGAPAGQSATPQVASPVGIPAPATH